ncbi:MAG: class I SAM-dependent methyltransferase [Chloroflexota bacterium]
MIKSTANLSAIERTMIFTLRPRADEHIQSDGLFRDSQAAAWFAQVKWPTDFESIYDWKMQTGVAIRVKIVDEVTERFMASRAAPLVVELGAGLSTRADRLGLSQAQWLVVDLPTAIAFRQEFALQEDSSQQVAGSVLEMSWLDLLPPAQSEDVLFIAEGLLPFFEREQVTTLIERLRMRFPGATLAADVMGEANRANAGRRLEMIDAPAHWFVSGEQELVDVGLSLVQVWPLIAQYPHRWDEELAQLAADPVVRNSSLIFEARL